MRVVNDGKNVKITLEFDEVGSVAVALDKAMSKLRDIGVEEEASFVYELVHKLHNPEVILKGYEYKNGFERHE